MNTPVRIESIRVREIERFARETLGRLEPDEVVPVGQVRAKAYAANPLADDNDVGLLVAYSGTRCIGYLGIMPGRVMIDGTVHKLHWFSSWYVDPNTRQSGAGILLLMKALSLDYDFAVTGTSRDADEVYQALHFTEIKPLTYWTMFIDSVDVVSTASAFGVRVFRRLGLPKQLPQAVGRGSKRLLYPPLKRAAYAMLSAQASSRLAGVTVTELRDVRASTLGTTSTSAPHFHRGPEVVQWMLDYPWFTERKEDATPRYYFHEYRDTWRHVALRIESPRLTSPVLAALSLSRKDGLVILKLLDHTCTTDAERDLLCDVVIRRAAEYRADRIVLPDTVQSSFRRYALLRFAAKRRSRRYFCRPKPRGPLSAVLSSVQLDVTDGDSAFS
jgi:hypothetical protein